MKNLNKSYYVLTEDGFKDSNSLSPNCSVSTIRNNRTEFNKISFTSQNKQPLEISDYTYLQTSIHCFGTLYSNSTNVLSISKNECEHSYKNITKLKVDDWVYSYWVKEEREPKITKIDLSKYCDSFQDLKYIYMFNSSVKDIAKELNISTEALKELLVREAAEYDEYLPKLKQIISDKYNITEESSTETSFLKLKKYLKDNFVFKLDRFINIDKLFMSFIISYFLYSRLNKKEFKGHNAYIIDFNFKKDDPLLKDVVDLSKKLKLKYKEITLSDNTVLLSIFNKPLYLFLNEHLSIDISSIINCPREVRKYFVDTISERRVSFNTSFNVALQFTELFNYYKKVIQIDNDITGVEIKVIEDDFFSLDSNLIIDSKGYYTKIVGLYNIESGNSTLYTFFNTGYHSKDIYTTLNCTVRD